MTDKADPTIVSVWGKENPKLDDELVLKVRATTQATAIMLLHDYLMREYGLFFNMQVLEPVTMVQPGIWSTKLRAGRVFGDRQ